MAQLLLFCFHFAVEHLILANGDRQPEFKAKNKVLFFDYHRNDAKKHKRPQVESPKRFWRMLLIWSYEFYFGRGAPRPSQNKIHSRIKQCRGFGAIELMI